LPLTDGDTASACAAPAGGRAGLGGRRGAHRRPSAIRWTLLLEAGGRTGAENMAIDVELLERADRTGEAFVRFYRFDPPCLSLGRNEAATGYDRAAIARLGVDVVRRPTGGRAVWHEHELTYAVAAPIATFGGLHQAYHAIHQRLAMALRSLGADATLASHRPTAPPPDRPCSCFTAAVGGEVIVGGRKVVGSAQVRRGGAFLQHGSILLDESQDLITAVTREPQAASGATTLAEALRRPVTWNEVVEAVVQAWGDECTPTALYRPLPPSTALFADPAWTWRR
jgi:lipoyl(octanoyl) transferase